MKRPPIHIDGEGTSSGSKRRRRISSSDDDDDDTHKPTNNANLDGAPPMHKIYNSSCKKEKPAELFRKDLISAMKLPDNEQLDAAEFWDVSDTWKQEWERGVQVPVNSKHVPNPEVRILRNKVKSNNFKLPKKLIRTTQDSFFSTDTHVFVDTAAESEQVCKYDMDDLDNEWLKLFNKRREDWGLPLIEEQTIETILEDFETQCSNRFQDALKTEKGLGIEYDEDVICDVCRSPDCEEGNEMVFCDSCNICVHQACYGIMAIPEGSWICRPCALNIQTPCILCPNSGGALKSTSSGEKWAHVSCALWIPEVSIGCPEKMEPILRISHIPASRWALICSLCRERVGACIQCSVKQCKVAYHVTCAFENGLEMEMKSTPVDSQEEGVKMQSFCPKHSRTDSLNADKPSTPIKSSERKGKRKRDVKRKEVDSEVSEVDDHNARLQKIRSLEAEFHKYVKVKDTAELHSVHNQVVSFMYHYWVLKRRAKFNKPLLIAKCDEASLLIKQQENILYSRLKLFVHLRQDLERVRNLCYMVSRREKLFRAYLRLKDDIFEKQCEILSHKSLKLSEKEFEEVLQARIGNSLYDKFYSVEIEEKKEDEDGKSPCKKFPLSLKLPNPYAKSYSNGIYTRSRRHTTSQSTLDGHRSTCKEEGNDLPKLQKCKSEENIISAVKLRSKNGDIYTHSPLVIKVEPKHDDNESDTLHNMSKNTPENNDDDDAFEKTRCDILTVENQIKSESINQELNAECNFISNAKINENLSEVSNDKSSLSLSDKENINAHPLCKIRKVKNQIEIRHKELKSINDFDQKTEDLLNECCEDNLLGISEESDKLNLVKKCFRPGTRSTRYQMRTRNHSNSTHESEEAFHISESDSPKTKNGIDNASDNAEEFKSVDPEMKRTCQDDTIDVSKSLTQQQTPRRRRGRPRRVPLQTNLVTANLHVIKDGTATSGADSDKNTSCDDMLELSNVNENSELRMSLRHSSREHSSTKTTEQSVSRKSIVDKLETSDSLLQTPLKEANNDVYSESLDVKSGAEGPQSSPDWDPGDTPPRMLSSIEPPVSPRLVIRLRKDPNRETWKNDSSSSSDVPAAFRIVRNDWDINGENSGSQFSVQEKNEGVTENQTFSDRNDSDSKHRYLMRERSVPQRNLKYSFGCS